MMKCCLRQVESDVSKYVNIIFQRCCAQIGIDLRQNCILSPLSGSEGLHNHHPKINQ